MLLTSVRDEFIFECEYKKYSPKTTANYKKQIDYFLNFLQENYSITKIEEVKPLHVKRFVMQKQQNGNKANYINDLLKAIKVLLKFAHEEGYTEDLITAKVKNVKTDNVIINSFSEQEVKKMLECYNGHKFLDVRNKAILGTLFDTGIRLNELLNLKQEDIRDGFILIKKGKGGKDRVVPVSPYLHRLIFKYSRVRESYFLDVNLTDKELFLSKNCKKLSHTIIERLVKKAGIYANVSSNVRCSPHTCRHTFAHIQLKNGIDIYSLSRLLGHSNVSITQTYLNGIKDERVIEEGLKTSVLMNLK